MSSESFADLGVSRPVLGALAERGITEPFAVQRLCIADVLAGEDVLVQSPTGSGKTLAFGIPMAERIEADARRPAALVLAPTRELAEQIVDELRSIAQSRALKIAPVFGGVGIQAQAKKAAQGPHRRRHPRPPRGPARPRRLQPEADPAPRPRRGRPHARHGLQARGRPDRRQDAARSPDAVLLGDARGRGRQARRRLHAQSAAPRPRAEGREATPRSSTASSTSLTRPRSTRWSTELRDAERGRTLVFVRTKRGADRLVKRLGRQKIQAVAMHGNKTQSQRRRALAGLRARRLRHPGRHRRRLPRDRRRGHHPRDQLRRPRGPRHLRAPHRPHRPGGRLGDRRELRPARPASRDAQDRRGPRAPHGVRRQPRRGGRRGAAALQRQRAAPCQRQRPSARRRERAAPQAPSTLRGSTAVQEYRTLGGNYGCVGVSHADSPGMEATTAFDPSAVARRPVGLRERLASFLPGMDEIGGDAGVRLERYLRGSDAVVLHRCRIPGKRGKISHVIVGPAGVTVVDSRNYNGRRATVRSGQLLVGNRDRADLIEGVHRPCRPRPGSARRDPLRRRGRQCRPRLGQRGGLQNRPARRRPPRHRLGYRADRGRGGAAGAAVVPRGRVAGVAPGGELSA